MGKFNEIIKFLLILIKVSSSFAQQTRIVGGTPTTIKYVPYLVQLLENEKIFCGGTLVSLRYVVTAAHCVKGKQPDQLTIVGGASRLSDAGVRSKVSKIMIPNGFKTNTMNMDVAVLKLNNLLTGKNVKPIALCTRGWKPGASIQVSGWGSTTENSNSVPQQVRTVRVNALAKKICTARYRKQTTITKSMFCAAVPGRKDACLGDSGGPAIYNDQLCGIVSWGIGCARRSFPGIYTNVRVVRKFITSAMRKLNANIH